MTPRHVAAFDFDGTLTRRDTLLPFLVSVAGPVRVARGLAAGAAAGANRDLLKERLLTHVIGGRAHADIASAGEQFGARLARNGLSSEMQSRVAWHRREGHEIVIVSATLDVYLGEIGRALGAARVLSTALDVDGAQRCTGKLAGGNCRGPEKASRLRAYLGDDNITLWAYGNSIGDREMLAMAAHPVRARRGRLRS